MKKTLPALLAALLMTALLGAGMLIVGSDALFTQNASAATVVTADNTAEFQQMLVQYQTREALYTDQINTAAERLTTANQQLEQANLQIQQYQSILAQLQQQGLITIASDGTVTINQQTNAFPARPKGHHE